MLGGFTDITLHHIVTLRLTVIYVNVVRTKLTSYMVWTISGVSYAIIALCDMY